MKSFVKNKIFIIIILSVAVLLIPNIIRYVYYDWLLIGEDSYYNLRLANLIRETGSIPIYDDLSYGGRPIVSEIGWILLLSINPEIMSRFLPFIFGVLSSIIFFMLIKKTINSNIAFLSTILFIISPSFIYLFSVSTKFSAAIFFGLVGFYLIFLGHFLFGVLFLSIISLFSFWGGIVSLFLFIVLSLRKGYEKKWFLIIILLNFVFLVIQYLRLMPLKLAEFVFFYLREEGVNYFFQRLVSDFGGLYGVGFVSLILALVGIYQLWRFKYKYLFIYFAIFVLLILNVYLSFISFYLNIFIVLLAGYAFIDFVNSKWENLLVKKITIFIIICSLLFSSVSYIDRLVSLQPTKEVYDAIYYLDRKPSDDVVFSYYKRGLWINYGDKKNVMDSNMFYAPDVKIRFRDSETLLHTQDIDIAVTLLNKYNIKYIWVDKLMKENLWGGEEELLFLLRYSKRFKKVFDNGYVEIWRFKG